MKKKSISLSLILPTLLVLTACSALSNIQLPWAKTSNTAQTQNQAQNQAMNFASQPVENKLAIGILKLEGTSNAVTAEQAKTLLPLWQAVKSLSASTTVTADEMTSLYQQIQDTLTADQVQAIKDLNLNQDEIQALMQQYNIQMLQPGAMPNGGQVPSAAQTQMANRSSSGGNTGGFPGGPGGGAPPDAGGFPGGGPGGQTGSSSSSGSTARSTLQPGQSRGFRGGMNIMFADPLIALLQQRSAS